MLDRFLTMLAIWASLISLCRSVNVFFDLGKDLIDLGMLGQDVRDFGDRDKEFVF